MSEVISPGNNPNELVLFEHGFVRLDAAMADDLSVVNSARVSFAVRRDEMDDRDKGLIRFLMRDRHGCYDEKTDVLTSEGWKPWPTITGEELFATRSPLGSLEYQPALRLVHKEVKGPMIGFKGMSIDMMVTPDHRVLASPRTTRAGRAVPAFDLTPAHRVLWRPHRHIATADWNGLDPKSLQLPGFANIANGIMKLVGFFIGDGYLGPANGLQFHLRKQREIQYLMEIAWKAHLPVTTWGEQYVVRIPPALRRLFTACYDANREKQIPRFLLDLSPAHLEHILEGLLRSDGTIQKRAHSERQSYYTTSKKLADSIQELALKIGRSASVRPHTTRPGDGHYGSRPRWRVNLFSGRNTSPGLCRTRQEADNHMGIEEYNGTVHCVEVPNGTLYVRRNGYPVWSGNTPFEHNSFRFHIRAPIFVAREWFRHRIGSFNEESARYHKLSDDFYLPDMEAVRSQVGKPGSYKFEPVEEAVAIETRQTLEKTYKEVYATYMELIEKGVAKEVARAVLPVGIFTQFYWTINARALMNFLSLRNAQTAQYEIRMYAEAVERLFAQQMPITHQCFIDFGRVSP